jgi:hypothetical protein
MPNTQVATSVASVEALKNFTSSLPASGEMSAKQTDELIRHLAEAWDELAGTSDQKTFAAKLQRAKNLSWNPPLVTFTLERHGGTVQGSTRAELHHWEVNVEVGAARITSIGARQLHAPAKRMDIGRLARETAHRIISGANHPSLQWRAEGAHVVILIAELIPEENAQTTASRRERFRAELDRLMKEAGWERADQGNRIGFRKLGLIGADSRRPTLPG